MAGWRFQTLSTALKMLAQATVQGFHRNPTPPRIPPLTLAGEKDEPASKTDSELESDSEAPRLERRKLARHAGHGSRCSAGTPGIQRVHLRRRSHHHRCDSAGAGYAPGPALNVWESGTTDSHLARTYSK
jgi:hypothetical protein